MTGLSFKGYRDPALSRLKELGISVWADVVLKTTHGTFEGIVLPRSETEDEFHIVLKLKSGYNVGVRADSVTEARQVGHKEAIYKIPESEFPTDPSRPDVSLFGTGGTIASRLDYRTGAVIPAFTPGELYGAVPELADICNLKTEKLFGVFSENMGPEQYVVTAKAVAAEIEKGVKGIVIGHGTDTLHHTASILSFMLQDLPVPVVLVGSQRSSDRPSSDAALNLRNAVKTAAECDIAEVMVCMFGPTSDQYALLHRGTRVRKMHSSYRSTFRTIGDIPLAMVSQENGFHHLRDDYNRRRDDTRLKLNTAFEEKVSIVYYYPNMKPDIIEALVDNGYKGIVIAGTGLGHVNKPLYPALAKCRDAGVAVYMTVQTLWGYVHMRVYETGRDMIKLGVVEAENMLPEVAYMKLCWVLGQTTEPGEVRELMLNPIAGEITDREPPNGYLVYQGGVPEVEEFISRTLR
ncbi:MAG TPA: Glu-tRNA(Gln) amidotransferase subunit GatD [candidate division WOR-3 bacterium]|uniref:Glu-tRNA(Gln) amidotransferase subunit GatD n=1 Tax=candidate division WOR-3 bacterium TaxID=2052148 RepID=A0A7V0T6M5_UNCW3|nr:Glu-tRNA(Gln) amidotransferase subunit GatD [candidate division WOR-3 bacterium]